jgi:hypothetical protein
VKRVARFLWDFVVGDDWRIAAGVVAALSVTVVAHTWWVLPLAVAGLLALSVSRYGRADRET